MSVKLKLCGEQLYQVSDLLPQIELPEDGAPITLDWMKDRQEEISREHSRLFNDKKNDSNKLMKHKEMVLSELEKLRSLNRAHRKLMVEVWQHLTSLARVSGGRRNRRGHVLITGGCAYVPPVHFPVPEGVEPAST